MSAVGNSVMNRTARLFPVAVRVCSLLGVNVQECQVSLAQGDQVTAGAEVALGLDRLAPAADREGQLGVLTRL